MTTVAPSPLDLTAPDVDLRPHFRPHFRPQPRRRVQSSPGLPSWLRPAAATAAGVVALALLLVVLVAAARLGLSRVDAGLRRHQAEQRQAERSLVAVNVAVHHARR